MVSAKKYLVSALLVGATSLALVAPLTLADDYSYVSVQHLNIRSAGSVRGKIVAIVDQGYRVTVLDTAAHNWKHVLLENGQEGYVNGKFLSDAAPVYEQVTATRYAVKVAHAFVRSDGLQAKIAVLDAGDQVETVSDRVFFGRWIRVRVASSANPNYVGRVGYVSKRLVTEVEGYGIAQEAPVSAEDTSAAQAQDSTDTPADTSATDTGSADASATDTGSSDAVPSELNSAPAASGTGSSGTGSSGTGSSDDDLSSLLKGL